jgi:hypothetical protein
VRSCSVAALCVRCTSFARLRDVDLTITDNNLSPVRLSSLRPQGRQFNSLTRTRLSWPLIQVKHSRAKNQHEITQDLLAKRKSRKASLMNDFLFKIPICSASGRSWPGTGVMPTAARHWRSIVPGRGRFSVSVPKMGTNETWRAIEAAKDAFIDWSRKPAEERSVLEAERARGGPQDGATHWPRGGLRNPWFPQIFRT